MVACSTTQIHTTKKSPTAHPRVVDVQHVENNNSIDEEESTSPAISLVSEGIEKLKADLIDDAEWKFEEAVNLDPNYGPAYYWLARVKYRLGNTTQCFELLKKATGLLQNSEEWLTRVQEFSDHINSEEFSE